MIIYLIKLILILVFNICVNIYCINSECKCCCRSKQADTGSGGGESNSDILHCGGGLEEGDLGGAEQVQEQGQEEEGEAGGEEAADDYEHGEEQTNSVDQQQYGEEQGQNSEGQGGNNEEKELNNDKVEEEQEQEVNEEHEEQDGEEENNYEYNQNENNKTEPKEEDAPQEDKVIDVDVLESVVFTLSKDNVGSIIINNSDKRYSKADFDVKNIVNPLFEKLVWVYKITNKLYDSIDENSKIVFTYKSDINPDESKYIFCAVKVKDTGYFLMVCSRGNSICDEEKGYTYGLFDANNPSIKDSYFNFLSEEFKMISCGGGICDISFMFSTNKILEKIIFLEGFYTGNVTSMSAMFVNCYSLTDLNLSKFNTEKIVDIRYMFAGCNNLKKLNLSSFNNANSLEALDEMFKRCPIGVEVLTSNNEIKKEMYDRINRLIKEQEQKQEQENQEQNNENQ